MELTCVLRSHVRQLHPSPRTPTRVQAKEDTDVSHSEVGSLFGSRWAWFKGPLGVLLTFVQLTFGADTTTEIHPDGDRCLRSRGPIWHGIYSSQPRIRLFYPLEVRI
jgi:hypothetical protein